MNDNLIPETESIPPTTPTNDVIQPPPLMPEVENATPVQKEAQPPSAKLPSQAQTKASTRGAAVDNNKLGMLMDVNLVITVELGRTNLSVREVLDLQRGSVVELDRMAGEAVDILVNDHLFAHGEVVVLDDKFGVRITEIIANSKCNA